MQVVFAIQRKNIALTNNAKESTLADAIKSALQKVAQPQLTLAA